MVYDRVDAAIAEQNFRNARRRRVAGERRGEVGDEDVADFWQFVGEGTGRDDGLGAQLHIGFGVATRGELQAASNLLAQGKQSVVEGGADEEVDALVGQIMPAVMGRDRQQLLRRRSTASSSRRQADPRIDLGAIGWRFAQLQRSAIGVVQVLVAQQRPARRRRSKSAELESDPASSQLGFGDGPGAPHARADVVAHEMGSPSHRLLVVRSRIPYDVCATGN